MCENCFDKEIPRFESQSEFIAFEKILDQKLKFLINTNSSHEYLKDYHYCYKCLGCNQSWWLSIPDNAWRGYFLTEKKAQTYIENLRESDKKRKNGCLITLGIILVILIITIFSSCTNKTQKFEKGNWNKIIDGFYVNRENMVEDLTNNYLKKGMKYEKIMLLLGNPQNLNDEMENTISYELMTDYGWDIDPVEVKTLKIKIAKDSTLLNWEIEHWKK
jgi:outer membrane protein assembly factor BamE (lipoprotein component of BamABCDE complex)